MPTLQELINKRIEAAEEAQAATLAEVRAAQGVMYTAFIEWLTENIETNESGRIVYTARNLQRVSGVYRLYERLQKQFRRSLLSSVLSWGRRIIGLNGDFFESEAPAKTVREKAIEQTLLRWGYNVGKAEILPGSYFEALFQTNGVAQRVANVMNRAISQGMSLAQFQKTFRTVFVGKPGAGLLERHWKTNSFDLFQRIDRTANLIYADELELNWAIYSGTLETDSRPFCIARVNKVYSRDQIKAWSNLEFQGKPKIGYDPLVDCGGFNCRHHLSWISDGVANELKKNKTNGA